MMVPLGTSLDNEEELAPGTSDRDYGEYHEEVEGSVAVQMV